MQALPSSTGDYAPLLTGNYGFILSVAVTLLTCLIVGFLVKIYFTYRRARAMRGQAGSSAQTAVFAADAMWFAAHILAFCYFGTRFSTLKGLTEDLDTDSESRKLHLAKDSVACLILFTLAQYMSTSSVLCAAMAIPDISQASSFRRNPTYLAPAALFTTGLLLSTLPRIGCSDRHIFPGDSHLCPHPAARILPAFVVLVIADIVLAIHWFIFVHQRTSHSSYAGRVSQIKTWPVAPFALRIIVAGANIGYIIVYVRFSQNKLPVYALFYPELLSITLSLMATSSVSLSRILGKLNFAGVAYGVDPGNHRTVNKSYADTSAGAMSPAIRDHTQGWREQAARINNHVLAGRPASTNSEEEILGRDTIKWTVDIHQTEEGSASSSRASRG